MAASGVSLGWSMKRMASSWRTTVTTNVHTYGYFRRVRKDRKVAWWHDVPPPKE